MFLDSAMMDLNHHPADTARSRIVGLEWNADGPQDVPVHCHFRGQLIYTASGCVTVEADEALFVVPPHRAVWVPPGVDHSAHYPGHVAFRGIFIAPELCADLPEKCCVVQVDALVRELILVAVRKDWDYEPGSADARLMRVLVDLITALPVAPLSLPDARDKRIRMVMSKLRENPRDRRSIAEWALAAGMSERSFVRWFRAEAGMSFADWRQQLRITCAIEKLASGESVTNVAVDLGYASTSSFTSMFKKAMGVPPSAYFGDQGN